jgi:hypothetical protein
MGDMGIVLLELDSDMSFHMLDGGQDPVNANFEFKNKGQWSKH